MKETNQITKEIFEKRKDELNQSTRQYINMQGDKLTLMPYLTDRQRKLIYLALMSQFHLSDNYVILTFEAIRKFLNETKGGWQNKSIEKMMDEIMRNSLITYTIIDENGNDIKIKGMLITDCAIHDENKIVTMRFNPVQMKVYTEMLNRYTYIDARDVSNLKTKYTLSLYELAAHMQARSPRPQSRIMEIEDFYNIIKLSESLRKSFSRAKERGLNKAIDEINKNTCYAIKLEAIKTGKTNTHIKITTQYEKPENKFKTENLLAAYSDVYKTTQKIVRTNKKQIKEKIENGIDVESGAKILTQIEAKAEAEQYEKEIEMAEKMYDEHLENVELNRQLKLELFENELYN